MKKHKPGCLIHDAPKKNWWQWWEGNHEEWEAIICDECGHALDAHAFGGFRLRHCFECECESFTNVELGGNH